MPLALSDDELRIVMDAAAPLAPQDRDAFLRAVAAELAWQKDLGPGTVARVCRTLQRKHFDAPDLRGAVNRYSR